MYGLLTKERVEARVVGSDSDMATAYSEFAFRGNVVLLGAGVILGGRKGVAGGSGAGKKWRMLDFE